ncbi:MAG: dipeptidase [Pseudomonadales bacterium]
MRVPVRLLAACLGLVSIAACSTRESAPGSTPEATPDAATLARQLLIIDTHIDVPYRLHEGWEDVSQATPDGEFDYPRAAAGGLDALFMSIYIPASVDEVGDAPAFADGLIDSVVQLASRHPDKFGVATCSADVTTLKGQQRIAFAMGMENGGPIDGNLDNLRHFRDRGIRYVTLAHSKSNHISDSSYDSNEQWGGLSPFGRKLIPAMNAEGVMVDVSHISDKAFWQVLELTHTPVIASHSSLRHFTPGFQRNMTDEMVAALGRNGGVIQINFGSSFLTAAARDYGNEQQAAFQQFREQSGLPDDDPRIAEFGAAYRLEHPYPYATVDDVLDHIDRAVQLAGIDHVGLGSDFDGVGDSLPVGLKDVSQYPNLVAGLLGRGYSEADVAKILGGNLMRVWRAVETYAANAGNPAPCTQ